MIASSSYRQSLGLVYTYSPHLHPLLDDHYSDLSAEKAWVISYGMEKHSKSRTRPRDCRSSWVWLVRGMPSNKPGRYASWKRACEGLPSSPRTNLNFTHLGPGFFNRFAMAQRCYGIIIQSNEKKRFWVSRCCEVVYVMQEIAVEINWKGRLAYMAT